VRFGVDVNVGLGALVWLAVGEPVAVGRTVCVAAPGVDEAVGGTVAVEALLHPAASMAASAAATIFK
jgi:hypothetical protein